MRKEFVQLAKDLGIDPNKIETLQQQGVHPEDRGQFFPTGLKKHEGPEHIFISPYDMDFVRQLRKLPVLTRIELLLLTEEEMTNHIKQSKKKLVNQAIELLSKEWYWKETGDIAEIDPGVLPETDLSGKEFIRLLKSKKPPAKETIEGVIEFFTRDVTRAEVYTKD